MKRTGICPKCGADEVYGNDRVTSRGDRSMMAGAKGRLFIHAYVCLTCGYLEEHLDEDALGDQGKMDAIREQWRRVPSVPTAD